MPEAKLHLGSRRGRTAPFMAARVDDRRSRRRLWLSAAASVAAVAALGWGLYWTLTCAYFQVDRIEIRGFRYLQQETVAGRLRSGLGANLWRLDTAALSDSLAVLPWIRETRLKRRPPGTLVVTVREWRPVILVAGLDPAGRATLLGSGRIAEFPPHLPIPDLPVLVGYPGGGRNEVSGSCLSDVLDILEAVERADLGAGSFVEFVRIQADGYAVILGPGQQRLLLGREQFETRLRRYRAVLDEVPALAEVDLRFTGQVYIRESS